MRVAVAAATLLLTAAFPAAAQTAEQVLDSGIAAYRRLQLDSAATLFTTLLQRADLSDPVRARTLAFLGAVEFERGRRAEAARIFRDLVLLAPKNRLDSLTFTQDVRRAYNGVRETTKAVAVDAPSQATLRAGGDPFRVTVTPSSSHTIRTVLLSSAGAPLRTLFEGPISEATQISWDGLVGDGVRADSGRYTLVVSSSAEPGVVLRHVRLPVLVQLHLVDTLLTPARPDTAFLPEQRRGDGIVPLAAGLLGSAATVALPQLFGEDGAGPARFAVGGAIGIAGIIGFVTGRRREPIAANVAANRALRDTWQQEADRVAATNRERRRAPALVIRTGPIERREGDWR